MDYKLDKKIWTDADFDEMGWHDCHIYKLRLTDDLELDIDYILQWNKPALEGLPFTFWIAPATMVFKRVHNLKFDFHTAFEEGIEIEDIIKGTYEEKLSWTIISQQGDFEFIADGYEMYIRQEPFFQFGQSISYIDRYGISLERTTNQENPNRSREDILARRKKDLEQFELAKKRHLKRQEQATLLSLKEHNRISTKDYLLKKRDIAEILDYYDRWLKDTDFENW